LEDSFKKRFSQENVDENYLGALVVFPRRTSKYEREAFCEEWAALETNDFAARILTPKPSFLLLISQLLPTKSKELLRQKINADGI